MVEMILRYKPEWANEREGRDLLRKANEIIKGTEWEAIVYPPPSDPEVEKYKWRFDEAWDALQKQKKWHS